MVAQGGLLFSGSGGCGGEDRAATTHPPDEKHDGAEGKGAVGSGGSGQSGGGTEAKHFFIFFDG